MTLAAPKTLKYDLVNVFLAKKATYSGNPLAVFYGGEDLTSEQCLALGRQFNLSEITFPSHVSAEELCYNVRIFTAQRELPFAGHPTCGTAFAIYHIGLPSGTRGATQQSLSGATEVSFPTTVGSPYEPARISMRATARPVSGRLDQLPELLLPALGASSEQQSSVKFIRRAGCGLPWVYACIDSADFVKNAKVAADRLEAWSSALRDSIPEGERDADWMHGIVAFVVDGIKDGELQIKARVFFSVAGAMTEDSATGSAALGLGLVLYEEGMLSSGGDATDAALLSYAVLQGVEMNQPSQLFGRVELDQGKAVAVHVAGDVVKVGEGFVVVP